MKRRHLLGLALGALAPFPAAAATRYDAFLQKSHSAKPVGRLALGTDDRLAIVSARPPHAAFLRRMVAEVNAMPAMHQDARPPQGAPSGTDESRLIPRGDPAFPAALLDYLRTYYGLSLKPR